MKPVKDKQRYALRSVLIALTALFLTFALFCLLYRQDNKYTAGPPYGGDGVFSFSEGDLTRPLFLIDGWELYLDELVSPGEFSTALPPQEIFIGQYSNFSYPREGHSAFGVATYRIRLAYDGAPRPLTLEIPELFTGYLLWINGRRVAQSGSGSSVTFVAERETEIVLNIENHQHYYSGMTYPPALGTPEVMGRLFWLRTLFYAMLVFCPLTLALFSCVLWMRREQGTQLLFGLLCLCFTLSCLHPFVRALGCSGRGWYTLEDTARMAVLVLTATLCSEVAQLREKRWYRRAVRPVLLGLCPLTAASVFIIIPAFPVYINLYGALIPMAEGLGWLYLILCAAGGIGRGIPGGRFILAGGMVLGASTLLNFVDNNRFEPICTGWQSEYAGFLLVLIFGGMMIAENHGILQKNRQLIGHMEELVQQRTAELQQVLEERKSFFSDLAHNLKAPIAAIHVFIGMMRESNLYLDRELAEYLQMIESENIEMQQRVSALRTLNAFDRITAPTVPVELNRLLEEVRKKNQPETDAAGIHLRVGLLKAPVYLRGQREKLLILFENLIYNAISFTPEEGAITVTPRVEGAEVLIEVADTGSGIAPEHLAHIFERFYVGRENSAEGSGLGLYIARMTVEEMGGSISVRSSPGQGASFLIRLPLG